MSSLVCPVRGKNSLLGLLTATSRPATSSTFFGSAITATRAIAAAGAQDLGQVEADWLVELGVRARPGLTVRAPPDELGRMPEPGSLHVVVADLEHALGAQRGERQVLGRVPPAGHGRPRGPLA